MPEHPLKLLEHALLSAVLANKHVLFHGASEIKEVCQPIHEEWGTAEQEHGVTEAWYRSCSDIVLSFLLPYTRSSVEIGCLW